MDRREALGLMIGSAAASALVPKWARASNGGHARTIGILAIGETGARVLHQMLESGDALNGVGRHVRLVYIVSDSHTCKTNENSLYIFRCRVVSSSEEVVTFLLRSKNDVASQVVDRWSVITDVPDTRTGSKQLRKVLAGLDAVVHVDDLGTAF